MARKLVLKGSPSLVIVHDDGGNWQITLKEAMATNAIKFKLGEAFEDKFHGGKAYKVGGSDSWSLDADKLMMSVCIRAPGSSRTRSWSSGPRLTRATSRDRSNSRTENWSW